MKFLQVLCLLILMASCAHAANPAFTDFNTTQFGTNANKVAIKPGVLITNQVMVSNNVAVFHFGTITTYRNLSDATNAAVSGDTILLSPGAYTLSNTFIVPQGIRTIGSGDSTEFQSWVQLANGAAVTMVDNCSYLDFRITQMLASTTSLFAASIGITPQFRAPTNVFASGITSTNCSTDCFYASHTNFMEVTLDGCTFASIWDGGTWFPGTATTSPSLGNSNSTLIARNTRFSVRHLFPANTSAAHSFIANGGKIIMQNCIFEAGGVPTNALPVNNIAVSNSFGFVLQDYFNGASTSILTSCTFKEIGTTGSGVKHYDVANLAMPSTSFDVGGAFQGVTNNLGGLQLSGCSFDANAVTGKVEVINLPTQNGYILVSDSNTVVIYGGGGGGSGGVYTNVSATEFDNRSGNNFVIVFGAGVWTIQDDLATDLYTSPSLLGPWTDVGGGAPVPKSAYDRVSMPLFNPFQKTIYKASAGSLIVTNGFGSYRSNAVAPVAFTFPASNVNWTNPIDASIQVYIDNTGVTGTLFKKNGQQIFAALVGDLQISLQPGEFFSETYTVGTPVGRWSPFP